MSKPNDDTSYLAESDLLDSMYEFHPEFFTALSPREFADLKRYYRVGLRPPTDFIKYRVAATKGSPELSSRARAAYRHLVYLSRGEVE